MRQWLMERKVRRGNKDMLKRFHQKAASLIKSGTFNPAASAEIRRSINIITDSTERLETMVLLRKALKWGIDVPNNKGWWKDDDPYTGGLTETEMLISLGDKRLTALGRAGVKRLIKEERRKSIEWWIKSVVMPLTALLGVLIGLLAMLNKSVN